MKKQMLMVAAALAFALATPTVALAAPSPSGTTATGANNVVMTVQGAEGDGWLKVESSVKQASNVVLSSTEKVLASFEVTHEGDVNTTNLTLTFNVGSQYAGATAKVFIEHDNGDVETRETTVSSEGLITITVDRLSVFTVVIDEATIPAGGTTTDTGKDTGSKSPFTGVSTTGVAAVSCVAAVAAAGCGVAAFRKNH